MNGGTVGPEGQAAVVEYALPVIQEIRALALEGARSGFSGVEVGGVLFGKREDSKIRILTFRPLAGSYSLGPHFAVSDEDLSALQDLLEQAPKIRKLRGLEPVGWYRSPLDDDLTLADRDLQIFERYFPDPSQVAVLLQASEYAPTRVRFCFCSRDGGTSHLTSYREFMLESAQEHAAQAPSEAMLERLEPAPARSPKGIEVEVAEAPVIPARSWSSLTGWILALALAIGLGVALTWFLRPTQRLALQLRDAAGQLQITWNEAAKPVRNAQSAAIEITDGNANTWLELDLDQLRRGNVTYVRQSNIVAVRLKIQPRGGAPVEEVARFLGPPEPLKPSPPSAGTVQQEAEPPQPSALPQESPTTLSTTVAKPLPAKPPEPVIARNATPRQFQPAPSPAARAPAPDLSPPPEVVQAAPQTVPASSFPAVEAAAPPPPADKPATRPAVSLPVNPAPAKPPVATVGRLIWTGQLPRNGTVTITGKKASAGALTGELPGKSVRIAVYPGDLSGDGIVIFTAHTQYAKPLAENPNAQTGWNKATYTFNPQRSGDVIVDEAPGSQNGWNRMVLRSKTGRFSVIVVDWTLLPQ
jgi:hypothetical protein